MWFCCMNFKLKFNWALFTRVEFCCDFFFLPKMNSWCQFIVTYLLFVLCFALTLLVATLKCIINTDIRGWSPCECAKSLFSNSQFDNVTTNFENLLYFSPKNCFLIDKTCIINMYLSFYFITGSICFMYFP